METHRIPFAVRTTEAERGSSAPPGSPDTHRDFVRGTNRLCLGLSATRAWLRKRDDLLASAPRLAGRGRLAKSLARVARRTGTGRCNRLVQSRSRQLLGASIFWGEKTGPNPTDRGKNGSKRPVVRDGQGTPLALIQTGANVHDSQQAIPLIDAIPAIKRPGGGRRKRPQKAFADRAYDAEAKIRQPLRQRRIKPYIAKRNTEPGSGLGRHRCVVEGVFAWLFQQRRLRVRYEKRADIHEAFLDIGCLLICWNRVEGIC